MYLVLCSNFNMIYLCKDVIGPTQGGSLCSETCQSVFLFLITDLTQERLGGFLKLFTEI